MLATRSASWLLALLERLGLRCLLPPCAERMLRMWTSVALKKATMKGCLLWGPLRPTSPATHGFTLWPAGGDRETFASLCCTSNATDTVHLAYGTNHQTFLHRAEREEKHWNCLMEMLTNPAGRTVKALRSFMGLLKIVFHIYSARQIICVSLNQFFKEIVKTLLNTTQRDCLAT